MPALELRATRYDHPDAQRLIADLQAFYAERYGDGDDTPVDPAEFAAPAGYFAIGYVDGAPVACGGWRARDGGDPALLPGDAEIKRMYVAAEQRGRGHARAVLAELERAAAAAGRLRTVLETGTAQPEAIGLYLACGYRPMPRFGYYREYPNSRCFAKPLVPAARVGSTASEGFKIVELNCGAGIGGWQIHWMDGQYRKQPGLDRFLAGRACHSRHIPREFMAYLIRAMVERGLPCRLVMVTNRDFAHRGGPAAVRAIFDEALQPFGRDGEIRFVEDPSGLQPRADGIYHQGSRIGAFVGAEGMADLTPMLLRAALANQLFWPDSPLDTVLGDKRALALLYQHRDSGLFSPAEQALVDEFIPWSAPVRPGTVRYEGREQSLETLLRQQPAQFVVKAAQGMQGDDVFIGKYAPPAQWDAVVSRALAEPGWLAQGFCASLPFYGQRGDSGYGVFDVIWGVFGFGNRYGGTWLRLMDKDSGDGVINSSKGAQEAIVYEVEA